LSKAPFGKWRPQTVIAGFACGNLISLRVIGCAINGIAVSAQ